MSYSNETTGEEIAKTFASSIKDKSVLITGVTWGGIGAESARIIAPYEPKLIILAGRTLKSIEDTIARIKAETPSANLRPLVLDLGSIASVRKAAKEVNEYKENVDVLINNAGVMATPYGKTVDGFETQFGTNHLGHFLFTNLIMPKLLASQEGGRIVSVSSVGHGFAPIIFDNVGFSNGEKYDPWWAYGQSKTANILFAVELAKKYKNHKSFSAIALHPGYINTNLARHVRHVGTEEFFKTLPPDFEGKSPFEGLGIDTIPKSTSQGTATQLRAAFDPSLVSHSGSYMKDAELANNLVRGYAVDPEQAAKLWKLSNELLGTNF